jgi:outer membrane protein assembly factor BamE (lipoprotein component of BamABCDE complex)
MKKVIALTVALLVIYGCVSADRNPDKDAINKITKGTTKSEVLNLIGIPDKAFYAENGDVIWSYIYVWAIAKAATGISVEGASAGGANTQQQSLTITFGPDGVLKNIINSHDGTEAKTKLSTGGKVDMPNIEENKGPK